MDCKARSLPQNGVLSCTGLTACKGHGRKRRVKLSVPQFANSMYFAFRKDSAFEDNKQGTRMSVMEPLSLFQLILPVLVICIPSSSFALALSLYVSQLNLF